MENFPRRNQLDKCTVAELTIYMAMEEVEKMEEVDVRLTDVIILLQKAKELLSDVVDEKQKA